MSYQKNLFVFVLSLAINFQLNAQNGNYELSTVVPPSPTAASLGKYGEIPVSLYTGIPNISIPLYEIKDGSLSLPISLSYHAGGVKVEEIASAVGLGWTLNAQGVVGRQIRGQADEYTGWITDPEYRIDTIIQNGTQNDINEMALEMDGGDKDSEADIYYYNFNGQSGKFFFDQDGTLYTYPAKNISIVPMSDFESATGWRITTEDGTIYEFDKIETVTSVSCSGDNDFTTAWYLSKIISSDGKKQITFTYENVTYSNQALLGQTMYFNLPGSPGGCLSNPGVCIGSNITYTHRLKQIDFTNGYVKFIYDNSDRADLAGEKKLDGIEIYRNSNDLLKKYEFVYSYFGAGSSDQYGKRLKLDSLSEKSVSGQKPPYVFTYEESIQMPSRNSYSQDHWGFYNGKTNTSLIPNVDYTTSYGYIQTYAGGADRNADPDSMQACILKEIQYPTGGRTVFTYEANTTSDPHIAPQMYDEYHSFSLNQAFSSLTSPYETDTFTIPALGADVYFSASGLENSANCESFQWYLIKDGSPTSYTGIDNSLDGGHIKLTAGTYKFQFVFDCWQGNLNYDIDIDAKIPVDSTYNIRYVGGLRIKQMEDIPGDGGQSVIKKYRYETDSAGPYSHGILVNFPNYAYELEVDSREPSETVGCYAPVGTDCQYLVYQSVSNYPMATTQGGYVGYNHVVEDLGDNGEIDHNYLVYTNPDGSFPFSPHDDFDWRRGSELSTRYYARKNGELLPVKDITYAYTTIDKGQIKGYKMGRDIIYVGGCAYPYAGAPMAVYNVSTEYFALHQVKERLYQQGDTSKFVEATTDYFYDSTHLQLAQTRTSTSSKDSTVRDEVVMNTKYPQDYSFTGSASGTEAQGIKKLQDLHIVNVPIEQYTYRQTRNISTDSAFDQRIINGTITSFKYDKPYPDQIYRLETNTPISLATFGSGSALSSNAFIKNSNSTVADAYKPAVVFNSYDTSGNLTMQQKSNDVYTSYLWGYNNRYPVAQVVGATYSTISSLIDQSILNDPISDVALRDELNNLRTALAASKAQVTTYTYKPLVGATSVTDPNNRTTYYEYDDFNRLMLIRDQDKNIIQQICYNYAGQVENCNIYYNTPQSGNFAKDDCGSGYIGNTITYTVPANTYSSPISVDSANAIAARDVQANGHDYANANAGCTALINIYYYDYGYTGEPVYFTFTNLSTYQEYNFQTDPNEAGNFTVLGQLPPGNYEVDIYNPVDSWYHQYSIGCGYGASGYSYANCSFAHLEYDVNNICNTIVIDGN